MRKKSHVSLANHILRELDQEDLVQHNMAVRFGSLVPDLVPSFLTRKHQFDTTFDIVRKKIEKIVNGYEGEEKLSTMRCKDLGVITHYIADYFTLPHNTIFEGNLAAHCVYENDLKFALREYVHSDIVDKHPLIKVELNSVEEICTYIKECHENYLKEFHQNVHNDCVHIVEICRQVIEAIVRLLKIQFEKTDCIEFA